MKEYKANYNFQKDDHFVPSEEAVRFRRNLGNNILRENFGVVMGRVTVKLEQENLPHFVEMFPKWTFEEIGDFDESSWNPVEGDL